MRMEERERESRSYATVILTVDATLNMYMRCALKTRDNHQNIQEREPARSA